MESGRQQRRKEGDSNRQHPDRPDQATLVGTPVATIGKQCEQGQRDRERGASGADEDQVRQPESRRIRVLLQDPPQQEVARREDPPETAGREQQPCDRKVGPPPERVQAGRKERHEEAAGEGELLPGDVLPEHEGAHRQSRQQRDGAGHGEKPAHKGRNEHGEILPVPRSGV
jgi:hypothetical protein